MWTVRRISLISLLSQFRGYIYKRQERNSNLQYFRKNEELYLGNVFFSDEDLGFLRLGIFTLTNNCIVFYCDFSSISSARSL